MGRAHKRTLGRWRDQATAARIVRRIPHCIHEAVIPEDLAHRSIGCADSAVPPTTRQARCVRPAQPYCDGGPFWKAAAIRCGMAGKHSVYCSLLDVAA